MNSATSFITKGQSEWLTARQEHNQQSRPITPNLSRSELRESQAYRTSSHPICSSGTCLKPVHKPPTVTPPLSVTTSGVAPSPRPLRVRHVRVGPSRLPRSVHRPTARSHTLHLGPWTAPAAEPPPPPPPPRPPPGASDSAVRSAARRRCLHRRRYL